MLVTIAFAVVPHWEINQQHVHWWSQRETMTEETAPTMAATHITAVNVKLPPFWPFDPQVWFAQVEAQFTSRDITQQQTKFDYEHHRLPDTQVCHRTLQPYSHTTNGSTLWHTQVTTAASEQRRLQQLFNAEKLGDRKPTQLLKGMLHLLGDKAGALFFTTYSSKVCQWMPVWC